MIASLPAHIIPFQQLGEHIATQHKMLLNATDVSVGSVQRLVLPALLIAGCHIMYCMYPRACTHYACAASMHVLEHLRCNLGSGRYKVAAALGLPSSMLHLENTACTTYASFDQDT